MNWFKKIKNAMSSSVFAILGSERIDMKCVCGHVTVWQTGRKPPKACQNCGRRWIIGRRRAPGDSYQPWIMQDVPLVPPQSVIAAAIREAVEVEREECALLLKDHADRHLMDELLIGAVLIRSRSNPTPEKT